MQRAAVVAVDRTALAAVPKYCSAPGGYVVNGIHVGAAEAVTDEVAGDLRLQLDHGPGLPYRMQPPGVIQVCPRQPITGD